MTGGTAGKDPVGGGGFVRDFCGLTGDGPVATLDGTTALRRYVYLDTGATALMPRMVRAALAAYVEGNLANSHSASHRAARITTREIAHARGAIGRFVGADPSDHVVLFTGNGATAALNLLADAMFPGEERFLLRGARKRSDGLREGLADLAARLRADGLAPARDLVVVSRMEHHSNLLPWMRAVGPRNLRFPRLTGEGSLDMEDLERILSGEGGRVRVVAMTGASNVTGVMPDLPRIARMAHAVGAELVVDGAQWAPHAPIRMFDDGSPEARIDHLVLSGHKLYAPGSCGVLVTRNATFPGPEAVGVVGGGMADVVLPQGFSALPDVTEREEGGTPNLVGCIALGLVVEALERVGMDRVARHERELVAFGFDALGRIPGLRLYGPREEPRAAVFSFNVGGIPHGLLAAALSDYCNVAVRNSSFCAQLYVRHLLGGDDDALEGHTAGSGCGTLPGMVRASSGVYTTCDDLAALADGIRFVARHATRLASEYDMTESGAFVHRTFAPVAEFSIAGAVSRYFDEI